MRTSRYEGLNGLGGSLLAQGAACLNGLGGSLWGAACLLLHSRLGGLWYYLKGTFCRAIIVLSCPGDSRANAA